MNKPEESRPGGKRGGFQGDHTQSTQSTTPSISPLAAESFNLAYWLRTYRADPTKPVPHVANPQDYITAADLRAARDELKDWLTVVPGHASKLLNLYIQWRDGDAS